MFKRLLSSKTFWTGVGMIGFGVYQLVGGAPEAGVAAVGTGLGMIFLRDGVEKIRLGEER